MIFADFGDNLIHDDDLGNDEDGQHLPASPSPPFVRQREGEEQESASPAPPSPPTHPTVAHFCEGKTNTEPSPAPNKYHKYTNAKDLLKYICPPESGGGKNQRKKRAGRV